MLDTGSSLGSGTVARIGAPTVRFGPLVVNRADKTGRGAGDGGRIDVFLFSDAERDSGLPRLVDNEFLFKLLSREPPKGFFGREGAITDPDDREDDDLIGLC